MQQAQATGRIGKSWTRVWPGLLLGALQIGLMLVLNEITSGEGGAKLAWWWLLVGLALSTLPPALAAFLAARREAGRSSVGRGCQVGAVGFGLVTLFFIATAILDLTFGVHSRSCNSLFCRPMFDSILIFAVVVLTLLEGAGVLLGGLLGGWLGGLLGKRFAG